MKLSDQITRRHLFVAFGTSQQTGGLSSVDLAATRDDASVTLTASDGSVAPISGADATTAGVMTAGDKAKLDGLPPTTAREFGTLSQVPNETIGSIFTHLRTAGHGAPGDGGGALYKRVASEPVHAGKVRSADGAWWELATSPRSIPVEQFGAVGDGATDAGPAITAALQYAVSSAVRANYSGSSWAGIPRPQVTLAKGRNYLIGTTITLGTELAIADLVCDGGRANMIGSGTQAIKGIVADRMDGTTFRGINFINFLTAVEGDTNNTNGALITFEQCDFLDCAKGVDTRTFPESRSTVLRFDRCRANGTKRLVDSYCDLLEFFGGFYQSGDTAGAFVKADSLVTVVGGAFVPPLAAIGPKSRWFDLHADTEIESRGFVAIGTRFSGENGGIPVIYNYAPAHNTSRDRIGPFIQFHAGRAACSNVDTGRGVVILADNGVGGSIAPNMISVKGSSWHASGVGFVRTENGNPVNLDVGRFVIDIDQASQVRLGDINTDPTTPLVESGLEKYLSPHNRLWSDKQIDTQTGTITLDAGKGRKIFLDAGSATTITAITGVFDGETVELFFRTANYTVQDFVNGSRIFLNGSVDFSPTRFSSLTLLWDRAGTKWVELGRSVR